ncbi:hypothetical protein NA78x_001757 [Anatilimnocola sp. NA78]|uniref:hypothetical protein n=1 Tax=Anatilimnocola sp. NA78 TaxID=3415683 RepID=UPI003CE4ADDB
MFQLIQVVQQLAFYGGIGIVGVVLLFALVFWLQKSATPRTATPSPFAPVAPSVPPMEDISPQDAAEFAALCVVRRRFARVKCKEGLAAVQQCLEHFWAHAGEVQS